MIKRNFTKTAAFFLFLFSLNLLISCSSDDSSGTATGTESRISYKVNGQTFNCNIVGYGAGFYDNDTSYSGAFNNDSENSISFNLYNEQVGSNAFNGSVIIRYNGLTYSSHNNNNVVINNTEKAQGTFSGTFSSADNGVDPVLTITITEGQFEIFKD